MQNPFPIYGTSRDNILEAGLDIADWSTSYVKTYLTSSATAGQFTVVVSDASALAAGERIIIQKSCGTTTVDSGSWEFNYIVSINSNTLTLLYPLAYSYNTDGAIQETQVQRFPEFRYAKVSITRTVTAPAWNGINGGIVGFFNTGVTIVNGTITVKGADAAQSHSLNSNGGGYRGGGGSNSSSPTHSTSGESELGQGNTVSAPNGAGGAGNAIAGGGGQGGNANQTDGTLATKLVFGGGGGGGNANSGTGACGANGGGIIFIISKVIIVNGSLTVVGGNGTIGSDGRGASGGGGGGCIYLIGEHISLGSGLVTAAGGTGGTATLGDNGGGGGASGAGTSGNTPSGSNGSIVIRYSKSLTGTVSGPTPNVALISSLPSGRLGLIG